MTPGVSNVGSLPHTIFVELNEAERYFLDKFVKEGRLPTFKRMLEGGSLVRTKIPEWHPEQKRAWRDISPWMVWPSVYTGMTLEEHGLIGFGQDPSSIRDRCLWDVLDRHGISVGVFGSLMSYPPRARQHGKFYVPEALADDADCYPEEARSVQEFCVFSARNYSESFSRAALRAAGLLIKTRASGVHLKTIAQTLFQVPNEVLRGPSRIPERAMLLSYIAFDAFKHLYARHRPAFATLHLNHVAYMQHRYWRAAEPHRFEDVLSPADRRFFRTVEDRKAYEARLSAWIERSFAYTDQILGELLELLGDEGLLLVGTGLGQRPMDPAKDIHNPVVRLVNERALFDSLGLADYTVLHQMNPDVTVNFSSPEAAAEARPLISGLYVQEDESLFDVRERGGQLFLELNAPTRSDPVGTWRIRHRDRPDVDLPFNHHVRQHESNDQSTAHHKDTGWLLAYAQGHRVHTDRKSIAVTEIAPSILALYGIAPEPWMRSDTAPAFALDAPNAPASTTA